MSDDGRESAEPRNQPPEHAQEAQRDPRAWRERLAEGRFEDAHRDRLLTVRAGGAPDDPDEARAVAALADVQALIRGKAWARAQRRLERLEARPALIDWAALERELAWLREGSEALDRRETAEALETLDGHEVDLLEAERETQVGTALILDGRPQEAQARFERALALDPKHHRALTNMGNVALEEERVDEAIELYQRAIELDEGFANAHHNLGVAYRRKGMMGKSVRALRRAQRVHRQGDREAAREGLKRVGGGKGGQRLGWLLWGAAAAAILWWITSRGGV